MSSTDLKSNLVDQQRTIESSNQVDLNVFSQSVGVLNKETSFMESKHGPSVLLKHNVSTRKGLNDLQKSNSAPYLTQFAKPVDSESNLLTNYSKSNVFTSNLTSSPNLFKVASNHLLTSTPNLFNNLNHINNSLKAIENPASKFHHPMISADADESLNSCFPAICAKNVSFDYKNSKTNSTNIVRNVNLNCSIGSIYGLLGPSGCGM